MATFRLFKDGGRPPSWICGARVWTTLEEYLVGFIAVQNLVGNSNQNYTMPIPTWNRHCSFEHNVSFNIMPVWLENDYSRSFWESFSGAK